jgi:hypothetical protein
MEHNRYRTPNHLLHLTSQVNIVLGALNQAFCGVVHADSAKLVNPANGHCYQRFDTALYWNSAKTACAGLGGHLETITSQAENDWVYGNVLSVRITQQQAYASKRTQPNNTFQRSAEDRLR